MEENAKTTFLWQRFDRMSHVMESFGYVAAVLGVVIGVILFMIGSWEIKLVGIAIFVGGFLVAAYHLSLSMLMEAVKNIEKFIEKPD